MKKILSLLLAFVMVFSLATVAAADTYVGEGNPNDADGPYVDITTVPLKKTYKTVGTNAKNPEEIFEYTITLDSYSDTGYVVESDIPLPYFDNANDQTGTIKFTEGEATAEGDTNSVNINLPEYEYVGIYTYKIVETAGNTMGVTYDSNPLYLKVTVVEQNGKIRVAALHYTSIDGSKTESFVNTYTAGDLSVTKIVTGNLGDKEKDFSFNVVFNGIPDDEYVKSPIELWVNGEKTQEFWGLVNGYNMTLSLRDGQSFEFRNLPYGVTYTVTEADYTNEGYDEPFYQYTMKIGTTTLIVSEGDTINGEVFSATDYCVVDTDAEAVTVTNNKETEVDTGIALDSAPYFLMLAVAVFGMVALVSKKRYEV